MEWKSSTAESWDFLNLRQHRKSLYPLLALWKREILHYCKGLERVFFWHGAPPITRFAFFIAHLFSEVFVLLSAIYAQANNSGKPWDKNVIKIYTDCKKICGNVSLQRNEFTKFFLLGAFIILINLIFNQAFTDIILFQPFSFNGWFIKVLHGLSLLLLNAHKEASRESAFQCHFQMSGLAISTALSTTAVHIVLVW